jgi:hypothetical protein
MAALSEHHRALYDRGVAAFERHDYLECARYLGEILCSDPEPASTVFYNYGCALVHETDRYVRDEATLLRNAAHRRTLAGEACRAIGLALQRLQRAEYERPGTATDRARRHDKKGRWVYMLAQAERHLGRSGSLQVMRHWRDRARAHYRLTISLCVEPEASWAREAIATLDSLEWVEEAWTIEAGRAEVNDGGRPAPGVQTSLAGMTSQCPRCGAQTYGASCTACGYPGVSPPSDGLAF